MNKNRSMCFLFLCNAVILLTCINQHVCLNGAAQNEWREIFFSLNVTFFSCYSRICLLTSFSQKNKRKKHENNSQARIYSKKPNEYKKTYTVIYRLHAHTHTHNIILRTHALSSRVYKLALSLHLRSKSSARPNKIVHVHTRNQHTPYTLGLSGLYMIQNFTLLT